MSSTLNIAIIIVSVALIAAIMLQSKGVGLGSLAGGGPTEGIYTQRRGVEKVLFIVAITLSVLFLLLALVSVLITK
ncbi:MAG TPA: preprotein translocase subunit SecG [Anaerolineaceae bacterium]|nr:preprotein translocase subunit SecG [Anaerolineaceae bacterium]